MNIEKRTTIYRTLQERTPTPTTELN